MLYTGLLISLVFISVSLIGLILLQRGKGAEAGAAFGAGASGTVFGAKGSASFLTRVTAVLAALFFIVSLALTKMTATTPAPTSLLDEPETEAVIEQPEPGLLPLPDEATELPPLPETNDMDASQEPVDEGS